MTQGESDRLVGDAALVDDLVIDRTISASRWLQVISILLHLDERKSCFGVPSPMPLVHLRTWYAPDGKGRRFLLFPFLPNQDPTGPHPVTVTVAVTVTVTVTVSISRLRHGPRQHHRLQGLICTLPVLERETQWHHRYHGVRRRLRKSEPTLHSRVLPTCPGGCQYCCRGGRLTTWAKLGCPKQAGTSDVDRYNDE